MPAVMVEGMLVAMVAMVMMALWRRIPVAVLVAVALAGGLRHSAGDPGRPRACRTLTLRLLPWSQAQKFIGCQRGQAVLVDVWTTTCPACREHFPEFVQLHQRLAGRGLVCVSLNCDYDGVPAKPPRYYASRVLKFLNDEDATLTNILLSDPIVDFMEAAGIGSTPTYLLYGKSGELLYQFDGSEAEFTFAEVAQAAESAVSTIPQGCKASPKN